MKIRDIMTQDVEVVNPDDSLTDVARKMRNLNVGSMPVCDGRHIKGIITDRDITIRAVADGKKPDHTKVKDMMTKDIAYCYDDDDVSEAAKIMSKKKVRRLLVVNRAKQLIGVVSLGDLSVDVGSDQLSGDTLEDISKPSKPRH